MNFEILCYLSSHTFYAQFYDLLRYFYITLKNLDLFEKSSRQGAGDKISTLFFHCIHILITYTFIEENDKCRQPDIVNNGKCE